MLMAKETVVIAGTENQIRLDFLLILMLALYLKLVYAPGFGQILIAEK